MHKWRSEEHAILVGTTTVIADNPKLNVRTWKGEHPVRVVLDRNLRIPKEAHVLDGSVKTIVITEKKEYQFEFSKELVFEQINFDNSIAQQICDVLQRHQIQSVIIEGGTKTLQTFIDDNVWDEARVFVGDVTFVKGVKAPVLLEREQTEVRIKNDGLKRVIND